MRDQFDVTANLKILQTEYCVPVFFSQAFGQRQVSMFEFDHLLKNVLHQPKPITFFHNITMDTKERKTTFLLDIKMVRSYGIDI